MSEIPNEPIDAPDDTDAPEGEPASTEPTEDEDPGAGKAAREAAKYRRQLRAVEAERDTLLTHVEALQRAEVERVAGDTLEKPRSIWIGEAKLEDFTNADGTIDPLRVEAAAKHASEEYGLSRSRRGTIIIPDAGKTPSYNPYSRQKDWNSAFAPDNHN